LEKVMIRFSWLVLEQTAVKEIDINPLLVSPEGVIAMDARVALYTRRKRNPAFGRPFVRTPSPTTSPSRPRTGPPFGSALCGRKMNLFSWISIPKCPTVRDRRYMRPFEFSERVAHERLRRVCFVDYDRELVFVAEQAAAEGNPACIWAVGRLSRRPGTMSAQWSMLVADPYQQRGVGTEFLKEHGGHRAHEG
jgi:acetyltransferase